MVVDAVDHSVLKGDAAARLLEVIVAGGEQLLHVIGPVHGHDAGTGLAVRGVEGHRERQLELKLRQTPDARYHAAGGQADVPHPDVQPLGVVHQRQKPQHGIHVVQRLSNAHQHDIGDLPAGIQLGEQHLIQHLRGSQVTDLSGDGAGAEGAAHAAAHLRGDAHGIAVVILHEHRLDTVAVRQLPQVLDGAVQTGLLLAGHGGGGDMERLRQLLPQGTGQIAHLFKGGDAPVQPGKDLTAPEGGLSHFPQGMGQLLHRHGFDVSHAFLRIRQM